MGDKSHLRKLRWANSHIDKAEALIAAWRGDGYRIFQQPDNYWNLLVVAEMLKPLPDDLPLVVGDALHCLRDSLDHILFALSHKGGRMVTPKDEESPQFPIYDRAVDIQADTGIRFLNWHMSAEVCELAPDPARQPLNQHPLWLLNKVNNREKHREVALNPNAMAQHSLGIANAQIENMRMFGNQHLQLGAGPVPLLAFRGRNLQAQITQTVNVVFEGVEVADREVSSTLRWFHDHIRDVVFQRLEPFL